MAILSDGRSPDIVFFLTMPLALITAGVAAAAAIAVALPKVRRRFLVVGFSSAYAFLIRSAFVLLWVCGVAALVMLFIDIDGVALLVANGAICVIGFGCVGGITAHTAYVARMVETQRRPTDER